MAKNKRKNTASKTKTKSIIKPIKKAAVETIPFYDSSFWKKNWWKALIIFLLPFALYYQSTNFGYVLDDQIVVSENKFTKKGFEGIGDLLTNESMTGYFGEQKDLVEGNRYRPLSLITYAIEYGVVGNLKPGLSHFINILLYGLTGLLLFRVLTMMLRKRTAVTWWLAIPFLTSLLYIAHPIHSEAVANIKGRDEIMALLFSLATLYGVLRYMDKKNIVWLISSCFLFFLALLSKENSITFLAVIPLTTYFFSDYKWKPNFIALGALTITTIAYLGLRFSAAGVPEFGSEINDLMNNPFLGMKGGEKLATIMFTLYKYIQLYIFPHPLSHDYYPYAIPVVGWSDFRSLGSLFLYLGLGIWGIMGLKKKKLSSYAILFFLTTLTIVSNIVVNLGTFMNERFIYMASVGLALLLSYLLSEKIGKWKGNTGVIIASALAGIMFVGYCVKTITRVPDWESALSLNKSAVKNGTNSARANSFMATALYNEGKESTSADKWEKLQQGYDYATKAVKIHPTYQNGNLMKAGIAAELYKNDRDEKLLLSRFAEVMRKRPDVAYINEYMEYLEDRTSDMDYLLNWYVDVSINDVLNRANQPKWALHYLNRAYLLDKSNKKVLEGISLVYSVLGDAEKSNSFKIMAQQQN
ncbi:MAG: hypothetical protein ACJA1A_000354 [Saprospiraceae bacterium]|jgi:hypothetical protein|tara:strand:- start:1395 stop:3314 length:1920 start_codon:yes stop_codon:yes gene_type:complete